MRCFTILKNTSYALSLIALSTGLSVLSSAQSLALSDYDNVLNLTSDVTFQSQDFSPCNDLSITGTMFAEFMNSDKVTQQIRDDYMYANSRFLTNIKGQNAGNINNTFLIGYGNNLTLNWDYALSNSSVVTSANTIQVGCKEKYGFFGATGQPEFYLVNSGYTDFATVSYKSPDPDNMGWPLVYFSGDPNYPSDYSGTLIPDTFNSNPPIPDLTDDILLGYSYNDKHLELWNATPKPPLNTSTMACRWIIKMHDAPYVPYEDKITDCDQRIAWDFSSYMKLDVKLMILYDKTGDDVITGEEDIASIQRVFNLDGSSSSGVIGINDDIYTGGLKPCFTKTGVDFQGCWDNVLMALNMLTFGLIKLPSSLDIYVADECRNLTVLNSWLNLDNPRVCPAFPKFVRDMITPFVSVGLGLLMIYYITKRRARLSDD